MKKNIKNGFATQPDEETVNYNYDKTGKLEYVEYDYLSVDGNLFSTTAPSLIEARKKRDIWLRTVVDERWCELCGAEMGLLPLDVFLKEHRHCPKCVNTCPECTDE